MPHDPASLTAAVKAEARRLGFDLVGITTPDPPPHLETYRRWLAQGRHGEMHYLASERAIERRSDPRRILPTCRSILVLAVRYPPPSEAQIGSGRVAVYALGDDYHDVLPPRLRALVAFIESCVGHAVPHRVYTDTGPLLERDLAQRAGLGWIGKNTCLIHPTLGSYFLLAEVLLGIELQPDPAFEADRCGSCTRCLDACPTHCILRDRTLDATRCISYWTIERKGSIPAELRPAQGTWLFGCDICQQVCPWNLRFAAADGEPAFEPRPPLRPPDTLRLLEMDSAAFRAAFRRSPLRRPGRRGMLRNATVAAGNAASPEAVPVLIRLLRDEPEAMVRAHAAWALGRIGGASAAAALQAAAEDESDPQVRAEIGAALASPTGSPAP
ncbi:MAG: tRNA epoxyqueuosine(34) reductase QueG [Chloroflexota bacterium]